MVVNFWASWCVPCRREMPRLAGAARRLNRRVAFLGINYKDQRGDALAFARKTGVPYRSVIDRDGAIGDRYGIFGLPTTVFVDATGRIVGRYLGEMKGGTLDRYLQELENSPARAWEAAGAQPFPVTTRSRVSGPTAPTNLATTTPLASTTNVSGTPYTP